MGDARSIVPHRHFNTSVSTSISLQKILVLAVLIDLLRAGGALVRFHELFEFLIKKFKIK